LLPEGEAGTVKAATKLPLRSVVWLLNATVAPPNDAVTEWLLLNALPVSATTEPTFPLIELKLTDGTVQKEAETVFKPSLTANV